MLVGSVFLFRHLTILEFSTVHSSISPGFIQYTLITLMPVITSPSGVDLLTTTYLLLTQLNPEYSWLLVVRTGIEPVGYNH